MGGSFIDNVRRCLPIGGDRTVAEVRATEHYLKSVAGRGIMQSF